MIYVDVNFYGFNNMGMLSVPVIYALMIFGNVARRVFLSHALHNHFAVVDHGTFCFILFFPQKQILFLIYVIIIKENIEE